MRLALFDLDRTLIDINSGRLWVSAEWREGRLGWREVMWASYWIGRYSLGAEGGLESAVGVAVARMEGVMEEELSQRVEAWFEREVRHRVRPGAIEVLERHRKAGDKLVLATSGTSYAARCAAEAFGLDGYVATTLQVADGRLTGRIGVSCVGSSKATAVAAWVETQGYDLRDAAFYTDSVTDVPLLELVGEPVAVHPDRLLRRVAASRGWRVEMW